MDYLAMIVMGRFPKKYRGPYPPHHMLNKLDRFIKVAPDGGWPIFFGGEEFLTVDVWHTIYCSTTKLGNIWESSQLTFIPQIS